MECNGCGNADAYRLNFSNAGTFCNICSNIGSVRFSDVYFKEPYLDPNLVHPNRPHEKNGVWVTSRSHNAALMKEQGLREAGDAKHGNRNFDAALARRVREQF